MRILLPCYAFPETDSPFWKTLFDNDTSRVDCIVNPANGPGVSPDSEYSALIKKLRQRSIPILGYVATTYATKFPLAVRNEMAAWRNLYSVADIFLDEVNSDESFVPYYDDLYRACQGRSVLNPGTMPSAGYWNCGDSIVTAECSFDEYCKLKFPTTPSNQVRQSAHIVHGVNNEKAMRQALKIARKHASYFYCVDSDEYDVLPVYWPALVKECSK